MNARFLDPPPAAASSGAVAVPTASSPTVGIAMGTSVGSLKSTINIGAFSGSLSRSLVRHRSSTFREGV